MRGRETSQGTGLFWHMLIPSAAVALPLIAIAAWVLNDEFEQSRTAAEQRMLAHASSLATVVDKDLSIFMTVAENLARSPALARGDMETFDGEVSIARQALGAVTAIQTDTIDITFWGADKRVRRASAPIPPIDASPSDPIIDQVFSTASNQYSNLFVPPGSGEPRLGVVAPVLLAGVAQPAGAITIGIPRTHLQTLLDRAVVPDGSIVSIQDRSGLTMARSFRDTETVGHLPAPRVLEGIMRADSGLLPRGTVTLEGAPSTIAFARARNSGYIVKLDVADSVFLTPLRWEQARAAAVSGILVLGAMLLAMLSARQIANAFRDVPAAAERAARNGQSPALPVREANDLSAILAQASRERDASARALGDMLAQQQLFIDPAPAAIAMFDRDMRYVAASRRYAADYRIGNGDPETLIGRSHYEVFPEIDEDWRAIHRRVLAGETCSREEDCFVRQNGDVDWLRWEMAPLRQSDGSISGAILFTESITERKISAMALEDSRARLHQVIEASPNGIIMCREDGAIELLNRRTELIFGYDRSELLGHQLDMLIPRQGREDHATFRHHFMTAPQDRMMGRGQDVFGLRKNGSQVPLDIGLSTVVTPQGTMVLATITDISERKARDEAFTRSEDQLRQAQKMEAIGNLTGGIAHDFNNILAIAIGSLDLAIAMVDDRPAAVELLREATGAALRGADLTRQLLAFSRRQPLQLMPTDVNGVVAATIRLLRRTLREDIEISIDLGAGVWPTVADPVQLEACLVNLANNARDAMLNGGRLFVSTSNEHLDESDAASQPEVKAGDYTVIRMTDTGTGMPPSVVERIFEPFFTTKSPGEGSGLGLSMVFGYVKQSGGHITVYSEPGRGATFAIYLPRSAAADAIAEEPVQPLPMGSGETVLVVEDNEALRWVVQRQIARLGYRPIVAADATAALALLAETDVSLVFSDIVMPGPIDGVGLAREVASRWPHLRVVLTSGFAHRTRADDDAWDVGVNILAKPYGQRALAAALRAALEARVG